jgi:hypothetical protein
MLEIFNLLSDNIEGLTEIQPQWFNQQLTENEVLEAAAIYIQFDPFNWIDQTNGFQYANIQFHIHVVTEAPESGIARLSNNTMANHLQLVRLTGLALNRKFSTNQEVTIEHITRRQTIPSHDFDTYQVTRIVFDARVVDSTFAKQYTEVTETQPNVVGFVVANIDDVQV